jgi:hypothetical protein
MMFWLYYFFNIMVRVCAFAQTFCGKGNTFFYNLSKNQQKFYLQFKIYYFSPLIYFQFVVISTVLLTKKPATWRQRAELCFVLLISLRHQ